VSGAEFLHTLTPPESEEVGEPGTFAAGTVPLREAEARRI
jgi:hypothetical protein